jgi:hypothetical protein
MNRKDKEAGRTVGGIIVSAKGFEVASRLEFLYLCRTWLSLCIGARLNASRRARLAGSAGIPARRERRLHDPADKSSRFRTGDVGCGIVIDGRPVATTHHREHTPETRL